jgi:hypothetical protein
LIARYQRVLYWITVAAILLVSLLLVRGCQRTHERIAGARDQSPIPAPTDRPPETVPIAAASDDDGTVTLESVTLALPHDPSLRARTLLQRMFAHLASPASLHPVPAVPAVSDVFLVPLPLKISTPTGEPWASVQTPHASAAIGPPVSLYGRFHPAGSQLAVVNFTKAFVDQHPSGIESEELTLQAVITTLNANLAQVDEVLFLVDGQPRATLNGHADLSRPYAVVAPTRMIHVLSPDGDPQ